jgi:hypothetical protein
MKFSTSRRLGYRKRELGVSLCQTTVCRSDTPALDSGRDPSPPPFCQLSPGPEWMIERYGYEKARKIGVVAMVGGKDKTRIHNATPKPFRDLLISIAGTAHKAITA